jgi:hypothetical protein
MGHAPTWDGAGWKKSCPLSSKKSRRVISFVACKTITDMFIEVTLHPTLP